MARTKAPDTGKSKKTAPQKKTAAAKSPAKKQPSKATPEIDRKYRSLFDNSLDAILVADDEQNYIDANPAACKLLGYKKNELLKKNIKDIVHLPAEVNDQLWGEFIQKQTQANIIHLKRKDGIIVETEYMAMADFLPGMHMSILRDTTLQRMRESEERFRSLSEAAFEGLMIHDKGIILAANQKFADLLGFASTEEMVDKNAFEILPLTPESRDRLKASIGKKLTKIIEIEVMRKDGTIFPAETQGGDIVFMGKNARIVAIRDISERKAAENKFRDSEKRLNAILQTLMDGVVMVTTEGNIIFANNAAETILGIKKDEIEGKYYNSREWQQLDEFDNPYPLDQLPLAVAMREGRPVEAIEHAIVSPEGETKWLTVNAAPLFDENGRLYGAIAGFQDTTRRKQTEQQLVLNTRAIESVSEGIVITDALLPDEPIIYSNQGFFNITGYTPEEVLGRNCRFLQGSDTDTNTIKSIEKALEECKPFEGEILNYKKDGTTFWNYLRIYPITNQNGKMTHMVGFQSDITERKHMEEMLRQSEQRFMATFHSSPVPIGLIAISTGEVIDMNEACAQLLGYSRSEIMGQQVQKFELTASPDRFKELFDELQSSGGIKNSERLFRRKSGEIGIGLLSAELIEVNHQLCALLIINDTTEKKQNELRLRRAQDMLTQTSRVANIGGWEMDPATNTLYWSEITKKIHEVNADYEPTVEAAIHFYKEGESRQKIMEALQNAAQHETSYDLELQLITYRGRELWVRTLGEAEFEDGNLVRLYGSFQDITERKKAEIQLSEQLNELMRWNNVTTGREMRVLELKSEINRLLGELGKQPRYSTTGTES